LINVRLLLRKSGLRRNIQRGFAAVEDRVVGAVVVGGGEVDEALVVAVRDEHLEVGIDRHVLRRVQIEDVPQPCAVPSGEGERNWNPDAGTEWLGDEEKKGGGEEEYASARRHSGSINESASHSSRLYRHGGIAANETAGSRQRQGLLANHEICWGAESDPPVTTISELDTPPRCQFPLPSCTAGGL